MKRREDVIHLEFAFLFDVDGTIGGLYRGGRRPLRPGVEEAMQRLAGIGCVFIWSIVDGNAERLLEEYPELGRVVEGALAKEAFWDRYSVDHGFAIDDHDLDPPVRRCAVVLVDEYEGGDVDDGQLRMAADWIIDQVQRLKMG